MADKEKVTAADSRAQKYPTLFKQYQELEKKKDRVLGRQGDLRKKRDALRDKLAIDEAKLREMNDKLKKDMPELAEIDNELGALARAMGGRSLANPEA